MWRRTHSRAHFADIAIRIVIRTADRLRRAAPLILITAVLLTGAAVWMTTSITANRWAWKGWERMFGRPSLMNAGPRILAQVGGSGNYTITTINEPSAGTGSIEGTFVLAVNASGAMTGGYSAQVGIVHGFVCSAGGAPCTSFDASNAGSSPRTGWFQGTLGTAIDTAGDVAGSYADSNSAYHGFVRVASSGTVIEFDDPNNTSPATSRGTFPMGINDSGQIVGFYSTGSYNTSSTYKGFLLAAGNLAPGNFTTAGNYTAISAPNAGSGESSTGHKQGTAPIAINASGVIAGYYIDSSNNVHGFVATAPYSSPSNFTSFDPPGSTTIAGNNFSGTIPMSIDSAGDIVGSYTDSTGLRHGFIRSASGTITTFTAPGATTTSQNGLISGTFPTKIDPTGSFIVGGYSDSSGLGHGFIYYLPLTSSGSFTTFTPPNETTSTTLPIQGGAMSVNASGIAVGIYLDSNEVAHGFQYAPTATPAPTLFPGQGTYSSAQSVMISDTDSNAKIYYTTDGSTPTISSTNYTVPIPVSSSETIKAIALDGSSGYIESAVASAAYTINLSPAATPAFSPAAGTYSSAQTVTISDSTAGATIYYTTNGTTPTANSTVYSGPISVTSTETFEAIAVASGYSTSTVGSATYTFPPPKSSILHSFSGGTTDGDAPTSLIQAKDGNYYGTTAFGGSQGSCTDNDNNTVGCGTIFELSNGTVTVLYSFSGGADGGYPTGIIQGPDGNLYGTTAFGGLVSSSTTTNPNCGTAGCGVIFKMNPAQPPAAGQLVPLYTFSGASDPTVTTPAPPDGAYPNPLTQGAGGVFYGTSIPCSGCKNNSYGFLFSFTPGASTPLVTLTTFGNFEKQENQSALDYPNALIQVNATTLYGATLLGGDTTGCLATGSGWGCGGIFAYVLPGTNAGFENDVCYFDDNINAATSSQSSVVTSPASSGMRVRPETIVKQSSGRFPANGATSWTFDTSPMTIAYGADKNIYGASPALCVTYAPGATPPGSGPATLSFDPVCSASSTTTTFSEPATVFQCIPPAAPIASPTTLPTGSLNTVYGFSDSGDGGGSLQGLMLASDGNYYGTSGAYAFDLTPAQMTTFTSSGATLPLTSLSPFYSTLASGATNFSPNAMIQGSDGNFYGTTGTGGTNSEGAIFEISTTLSAPVQLSFTEPTIALNASSTLNWSVPSASSLTAEQCYAFVTSGSSATAGAWSGLQTGMLSNGIFSGSATITPTAAGSYTYALTCGGTVSGFATLQVNGPALTISPTMLPAGTAETSYTQALTAGGGSGTGYKFSVTTGASSLTALGISLSSAGAFSGTPTAGSASFTVQLVDSLNDNTTQAYTLTINKATPTVSVWPTPSAITYGKTLANSTLTGGTASVAGTFAWTTPSTAPGAGTPSESVTFTPTDTTDYNTVTGTVTVTVSKATPTVTVWPTASPIVVGQTLASSTLTGGTASVGGTFAWTAPSTTPAAGTPSESVTFTPNDTTDYNTVTGSVTLTISAAPGFTLSPSLSSVSIAQGSSGTSTITITDLGGFSGNVTLAATGLPTGVSSSFAAGTAGTQVLTLTVSASAQVTSSPVTVTVTGTSGALSAMTTLSLSVTAQPSFTPGSGGTTSISINPGATTGNTGTISIVGTNGFSGTVNLSCKVTTSMTNVNDMPSCSLNPASVNLSGTTAQTSTLTVTTTAASSAQNTMKRIIWPVSGTSLALVIFLLVPRRRHSWPVMLGLFILCVSMGAMGCGGGSGGGGGGGGGGNSGTTAGTYTITVTGTAGSVSATVGTVTLTVQ